MSTSVLRRPTLLFLTLTLGVIAACAAIVRSQAFARHPDIAAWGITFDLTITIPLAYWFFFVRTGKVRALTVAPLFIGGTIVAALLLPPSQHQFLAQLRTIAVPLAELALLAALVARVRRVRLGSEGDPYARIAFAARTLAGNNRVADVVASEVTLLYYALFCWRKTPEEEVPGRAFTLHERSGWATVLACIFVLLIAEGIGMHLLLGLWSPAAAWTWTALDLWGALWLLGDYHALRLRRSFIDETALHLRYGLRWSATVPLDNIASVEPVRDEASWRRRDVLKVAMLEDPAWLITLREPVVARGLAGMTKTIAAIALLPDDDEPLRQTARRLAER